ncbi:response regulator transcription factor [Pseudonocardia halophobica]|uniref:response regulator transcription factor n=1 Tax=Pseudonocardia halophobica TaxID=29401 RepID=UPI003D8BBBB9
MRLCIVDDHEVVREGLRTALGKDPSIDVVAEAGSAEQALGEVRRYRPDIVLTDFRLPDMPGDELCRRIRAAHAATAVVVLTTYLSEEVVRAAIDAGAAAFVTKGAGLQELRAALADVAAGGTSLRGGSGALVERLHRQARAQAPESRSLTPRQERVLELAAEGLTYREIATQLSISTSTVRFHIQGLKDRLGARTMSELVAIAIRSALITPAPEFPG